MYSFKDLCNTFKFRCKDELINYLENYNINKKKSIKNTILSKTSIAKCDVQNFYIFT
jgi:hypothetical protein